MATDMHDSDDERPSRGKTREWLKRRSELGAYSTIVKELIIEDRLGFKSMFRMSLEDFERVLGYIQPVITPKEIIGGTRPILAGERLALTLRYLATGELFRSLSFQFRISKAAISYIVAGCCDAIVDKMVPTFIHLPSSTDEWLKIAERFVLFPHALGSIDGKHVTIRKPSNAGSFYFNYKKTHSVILMAIAGPSYEFSGRRMANG